MLSAPIAEGAIDVYEFFEPEEDDNVPDFEAVVAHADDLDDVELEAPATTQVPETNDLAHQPSQTSEPVDRIVAESPSPAQPPATERSRRTAAPASEPDSRTSLPMPRPDVVVNASTQPDTAAIPRIPTSEPDSGDVASPIAEVETVASFEPVAAEQVESVAMDTDAPATEEARAPVETQNRPDEIDQPLATEAAPAPSSSSDSESMKAATPNIQPAEEQLPETPERAAAVQARAPEPTESLQLPTQNLERVTLEPEHEPPTLATPEVVDAASASIEREVPAVEATGPVVSESGDTQSALVDAPVLESIEEQKRSFVSEEVSASNRVEIRRPRRPRPPQPSLPEPRASDGLFVESQGDRSPQSWIERLVDVVRQERAQAAEQRGETPTTLAAPATELTEQRERPSESTRRFLTPLVGIDPADVPIHRGVQASRIADSHHADAVTTGGEVFVAAGFSEETPEGLGLLAHELTHVARNRQPRFVPPIAATSSSRPPVTFSHDSGDDSNEESVALEVEQTVQTEARNVQRARQINPFVAAETDAATTSAAQRSPTNRETPFRPLQVQSESFEGEPAPTVSNAANDEWGGLPTPWEPMPDWLAPAPTPVNVALPNNGNGSATANAPLARMSVQAVATADSSAPAAQTAATNRSSASSEAPASSSSSGGGEHQGGVEPDLDAMARQVYGVLKRRLAAERRRLG